MERQRLHFIKDTLFLSGYCGACPPFLPAQYYPTLASRVEGEEFIEPYNLF